MDVVCMRTGSRPPIGPPVIGRQSTPMITGSTGADLIKVAAVAPHQRVMTAPITDERKKKSQYPA